MTSVNTIDLVSHDKSPFYWFFNKLEDNDALRIKDFKMDIKEFEKYEVLNLINMNNLESFELSANMFTNSENEQEDGTAFLHIAPLFQ